MLDGYVRNLTSASFQSFYHAFVKAHNENSKLIHGRGRCFYKLVVCKPCSVHGCMEEPQGSTARNSTRPAPRRSLAPLGISDLGRFSFMKRLAVVGYMVFVVLALHVHGSFVGLCWVQYFSPFWKSPWTRPLSSSHL